MSSSNTSVDGDDDEHHVENQGWANSNHDANWEDGYYRIQIYDDDGDDFSDFWAPKTLSLIHISEPTRPY